MSHFTVCFAIYLFLFFNFTKQNDIIVPRQGLGLRTMSHANIGSAIVQFADSITFAYVDTFVYNIKDVHRCIQKPRMQQFTLQLKLKLKKRRFFPFNQQIEHYFNDALIKEQNLLFKCYTSLFMLVSFF